MSLALERPAWQAEGACHGRIEVMFLAPGESSTPAKALCAVCPVIEQCLNYALEHPEWTAAGIWGGTTERQRRLMRRRLGRPPRPHTARCGTTGGIAHHTREGTAACEECKAARNAADRQRRGAA